MPDPQIIHGDSLVELPKLEANSVDAIITDPPYELGFMGKSWDNSGIAYNVQLWREVFRVLKPGAYLLAFGGTRTYHRMACAIEDAGFEIRDQLQWIYGSGFPKSFDVSKSIDKMAGVGNGTKGNGNRVTLNAMGNGLKNRCPDCGKPYFSGNPCQCPKPEAVTPLAQQWNGWGTALKPANEPIVLARKPLEKGLTVAQNVLKWGTGAINVDGCRVEYANDGDRETAHNNALGPVERFKTSKKIYDGGKDSAGFADTHSTKGRWPANVIHDGSDEVLEHFPEQKSGAMTKPYEYTNNGYSLGKPSGSTKQIHSSNSGSAARFFYCAKASKSDRNGGLEGFASKEVSYMNTHGGDADKGETWSPVDERTGQQRDRFSSTAQNHHPTVKPVVLMQWLCRLITPPNGTILDPFLGSGSTAKAALIENFQIIGIELNPAYVEIAEARCRGVQVKLC